MSDLKIFTNNIEEEALNQINTLLEQPMFADSKIRIMPDVHAGKGCTIGFTSTYDDKIIPNLVGVDLFCGMLCYNLGKVDIDLEKFDKVIVENFELNLGEAHTYKYADFNFSNLKMYDYLKNEEYLSKSIGTVGGGNHFIELDKDEEGNIYIIVHSGSRNLGQQVAKYYQELAIQHCAKQSNSLSTAQEQLIKEYKEMGRQKEIQKALVELKQNFHYVQNVPNELAYLEGKELEDYLHDINICKHYASLNRYAIMSIILWQYCLRTGKYLFPISSSEILHNYVDIKHKIIRKGAIAAYEGRQVLIPLNMRDGCIIGIGKGNKDWNCSAPHGAGRAMSRSAAKQKLTMDDFKKSMEGIYTTSVVESTIDEAPMAYKPSKEIIDLVQDTVDIERIIKPIYNFKNKE